VCLNLVPTTLLFGGTETNHLAALFGVEEQKTVNEN
jgi:hypothetical protein